MPTRMVTVSTPIRRATLLFAIGLLAFVSAGTEAAGAQTPADSIARWTQALQSGSDSAKIDALDRPSGVLAGMPAQQWPRATQTALLAELNRLHAALLSGVGVTPGTAEDHGEYYMTLAGMVAGLRTREAALALVPAVEVGTGIQQRVARYGGEDVVVPLVALVAKRYSEDDALETLGFVWFWADSTGSALSDASRGLIVSTLVAAAASLDGEILPAMSAAQAAQSNMALVQGIARMVAVICSNPSTGRRLGTCQATTNDVATASKHFDARRYGPARSVLTTVAERSQRAKDSGEFTAAEYALLTGDLAALLGRSW